MFDKKRVIAVLFVIALSIAYAYALSEPKPLLYGQAFDGVAPSDGSTVTVYPQSNASDNLTDVVGETGKTGISGYWKVNLANLQTNVQNGNIVVIHLTDGIKQTQRAYAVNLDDGAVKIDLNLAPAFQDYDNDNFFADADCDDNNPNVNPEAPEVQDGIDNDCDDSVDEDFDDDLDGFSENQGDCDDNDNSVNPGQEEICGDTIDQDCDGFDQQCEFTAEIQIFAGWTSFSLPYKPAGIDNSEELGQAISNVNGIDCDVFMWFNGETQLMEDDILGLPDPSFALSGTESYFIHCNNAGIFTYQGNLWV